MPLENEILDDLKRLSGVRFKWRDPEGSGTSDEEQIGLVAQDVQKVFPSLVESPKAGKRGYFSVNYAGFVPILLEGVKTVADDVATLSEEVKSLLQRVANLENVVGDCYCNQLAARFDDQQKVILDLLERVLYLEAKRSSMSGSSARVR